MPRAAYSLIPCHISLLECDLSKTALTGTQGYVQPGVIPSDRRSLVTAEMCKTVSYLPSRACVPSLFALSAATCLPFYSLCSPTLFSFRPSPPKASSVRRITRQIEPEDTSPPPPPPFIFIFYFLKKKEKRLKERKRLFRFSRYQSERSSQVVLHYCSKEV